MSYILDALSKSQDERTSAEPSLKLQQTRARKTWNSWLIGILVIVLLCNAGLVVWVFYDQPPALLNTPTPLTIPTQDPVHAEPTERGTTSEPPTAIQPPPATVPQIITLPTAQIIRRFTLAELPSNEQTLYQELNYSTHIFTNDPSLCAIVIDGQRLVAGDVFKGLKVIAITEAGVVFKENRGSTQREVEVSVLEQWGTL